MNSEILGVLLMYGMVVALAIPLGRYIGKVFNYESTWLDKLFNPLDQLFFKLSGIDPGKEMTWQQHLTALLTINVVWFILAMLVLTNMSWLPLNPDGKMCIRDSSRSKQVLLRPAGLSGEQSKKRNSPVFLS